MLIMPFVSCKPKGRKMADKPIKILVIPDTQVKPGVPLEHLTWAGKAIVHYRPDVVVHLGDHADMASLSSYDAKGSKYFEGKRYHEDIAAAKEGMRLLLAPLRELQSKWKATNKKKKYDPRMVFLMGNHENRINRAINADPILNGTIGTKDLEYESNWEVHEFLTPVFIQGVGFNHYWPVGAMRRPAATAAAVINKLHMSCIAGHQQGKQVAYGQRADGTPLCSIIAGSFYLHEEDYIDHVGNMHWRGLVMLNEVQDGHFDEMFLSINYLKERFGDKEEQA